MKHSLRFYSVAFDQLQEWKQVSPTVFKRIGELIKSIDSMPYEGIGRPEALSGNWKGFWSRRITKKDRLVYRVVNDTIEIASCKFHYDDH